VARLPERVGTTYRGGRGQWSWALHRITGVGVLAFLFAHIADTALVGFGPKFYNRVVAVYHNPIIRLLEIGLAAMVLFHALNGLRIIIIDFFPKMADYHKQLFNVVIGLYVVLIVPALFFMGREFVNAVTHHGG
jgi:succinate dehydrogenase / fumarate reductase cytochrome b subunit